LRHFSITVRFFVVAACVACASGAGALAAVSGGSQPTPTVVVPDRTVPGRPPVFHWPAYGQAAVAVAGTGLIGSSPRERVVPIASLTKMMTALVVLHDHPLGAAQTGPLVTMDASDVRHWQDDAKAGDSVVKVGAGEVLTERQLLEALLIASGDNIADRLAVWDAGSIAAFVVRMNTTAAALGLRSTHYADPSGVDPRSASTAGDQALVASALAADPLVRRIVRQPRIVLPVAGVLANLNPALGWGGIVGLKGGFSSEAHYCLVTAAFRARRRALVLSVALGRHSPLDVARIDEALLRTASTSLFRYPLTAPDGLVAVLATPRSTTRLLAPHTPPTAVVWPGLRLAYSVTLRSGTAARSLRAGSVVADLIVSAPWGVLGSAPLRAQP
jgi:D-alanyl-D-alanine carboxypeptidase (penicillin-binding protein 5/6)